MRNDTAAWLLLLSFLFNWTARNNKKLSLSFSTRLYWNLTRNASWPCCLHFCPVILFSCPQKESHEVIHLYFNREGLLVYWSGAEITKTAENETRPQRTTYEHSEMCRRQMTIFEQWNLVSALGFLGAIKCIKIPWVFSIQNVLEHALPKLIWVASREAFCQKSIEKNNTKSFCLFSASFRGRISELCFELVTGFWGTVLWNI